MVIMKHDLARSVPAYQLLVLSVTYIVNSARDYQGMKTDRLGSMLLCDPVGTFTALRPFPNRMNTWFPRGALFDVEKTSLPPIATRSTIGPGTKEAARED